MTSKSSSSVWRLENVARTCAFLATDSRSPSCMKRGALRESEVNMASCPWLRYWREMPPTSAIASASAWSPATL
jgi:hypothetical protein